MIGLDGRQIRKTVLSACTLDVNVVLNPGLLTIHHLIQAIKNAKKGLK